jgi:hypothetical protein
VLLTAFAACAVVFYKACVPHTSRLDEVVFHDGPGHKLKIVRYYENLPLHYVGEVFRVMCQSPNTKKNPSHKFQDKGWRMLTNGGAIGTKSAVDLIEIVNPRFKTITENVLAYQSNIVLLVTFDACGSFSQWNPTLLPVEFIAPPADDQRCIKLTDGSCRYNLFEGDRFPVFDRIVVTQDGHISFLVKSKALLKTNAYRVESTDYGKTSLDGLS